MKVATVSETRSRLVIVPVAWCPQCRRPYDQLELLTIAEQVHPGKWHAECVRCARLFAVNAEWLDEAREGRVRAVSPADYKRMYKDGYSARVVDEEELRRVCHAVAGKPLPEVNEAPPVRWSLATAAFAVALVVAALVLLALGAFGGGL